jgi:hypothetical protein
MKEQEKPQEKSQEKAETGCCPRFDPGKWEEKGIIWDEKPFVKFHVRCFLHIPMGMGKAVTGQMALIEKSGAKTKQGLMISDGGSLWGSDMLIAVEKEVPGAENATLSGKFITKVFEGPYKDMGKWAKEMNEYVASKKKEVKKLYFGYTACPRCAKAYGKNYVVIFAEV